MINKTVVFQEELGWISDNNIRSGIEAAISLLPDYFFHIAASSTGKYHPKYALGDGGLVRHTKAAVKIAHELLQLEQYLVFSNEDKDLIIGSLILHDGMKHGKDGSKFTVAEHPILMASLLNENFESFKPFTETQLLTLSSNIASHMGEWNTDFKSKKEILPKPKTDTEKFVHLCDYLASRKYLEVAFDQPYNSINYESNTKTNELSEGIRQLISTCTEMISQGVSRDEIYEIIAQENCGKRNPNSISDPTIVKIIIQKLEALISAIK